MAHRLEITQEMLKRRRNRKGDAGFSLTFAAFVGLIGLLVGFILNLALASPPPPLPVLAPEPPMPPTLETAATPAVIGTPAIPEIIETPAIPTE